jgi:putative NADH-flavin reductase
MHILILGATGRVGSKVLGLSLADGHSVTALVRSRQKAEEQMAEQAERSGSNAQAQRLTLIQGDTRVEQDLRAAVRGVDAVISCLSTDGGTVLSETTPLLIKAMKEEAVRRIITVGTAGILQSREYPGMLRYESPETRRSSTRAAEEHRKAWELLAASGLEWTVICPTYLPEGERLGRYRVEKDFLPDGGMSISVADTADFTFSQLLRDEFIDCRVAIAY